MLGTTLVDWFVSVIIAHNDWRVWRVWHEPVEPLVRDGTRSRLQRWAIVASVVSNLLSLAFFKYFNFGLDSYNALVMALGWPRLSGTRSSASYCHLALSFYTFQSLSYTIDVYRGDAKAMKNFIDFSCFVSMYPTWWLDPSSSFHSSPNSSKTAG